MSWLVIGFWGCAAMWLISLAGDLGLARNPEVAGEADEPHGGTAPKAYNQPAHNRFLLCPG